MDRDTNDAERNVIEPTAEELEELADEWSTEYVEFELSRNLDPREVKRRYLVMGHYSTSAGRPIEWNTPSGFETLQKAAEFARGVADAAKARGVRRR